MAMDWESDGLVYIRSVCREKRRLRFRSRPSTIHVAQLITMTPIIL